MKWRRRPQKTSEAVRVGILGAGAVVKDVHLPVLCNMDDVRIVWICDLRTAHAEALARAYRTSAEVFSRIEDCPDIDIALVAIPIGYRDPPLRYILKRGWSALCEKPFACSRVQHESYVAQAAASSAQLGVGLMRRYYRSHLLAKAVVTSGVLGSVTSVSASQGSRMKRTGRAEWYQGDRRAAGGGVLIETGSHLIDQVFDILRVSRFELNGWQQTLSGDIDAEGRAAALLTSSLQSSPIPFQIQVSNINDFYHGIEFGFASGILKMGVFPSDPVVLSDYGRTPVAELQGNSGVLDIHAAFYAEWRDFIQQCQIPEHRSAISAETSLQTTAFIEECYAVRGAASTGGQVA